MNYLEQHLGKSMTSSEVAEYLGVDTSTVRKYYKKLGGMRLGRSYRFFEKEVQYAIQAWQEMVGPGSHDRQIVEENVSNESRSDSMGLSLSANRK